MGLGFLDSTFLEVGCSLGRRPRKEDRTDWRVQGPQQPHLRGRRRYVPRRREQEIPNEGDGGEGSHDLAKDRNRTYQMGFCPSSASSESKSEDYLLNPGGGTRTAARACRRPVWRTMQDRGANEVKLPPKLPLSRLRWSEKGRAGGSTQRGEEGRGGGEPSFVIARMESEETKLGPITDNSTNQR